MNHIKLTATIMTLLTFTLMVHTASAATLLLDFDTDSYGNSIETGQFIDSEYANWGINITAYNQYGSNDAITFDTANPTGGDNDLATPGYNNSADLDNVLILPTYITDNNNDGLVDDPNDQGGSNPGYFLFTFDEDQSGDVQIDFLDIEESGGSIRFYLDGAYQANFAIDTTGDNGFNIFNTSIADYDQIKIKLAGSGAVASLTLESSTIPEPASASLLALGALMMGMRPKRRRAC